MSDSQRPAYDRLVTDHVPGIVLLAVVTAAIWLVVARYL